MLYWQSMNIRKKLTYSILMLTFVLATTAGLVSSFKLEGAHTATIKYQRKFGADDRLDAATLAGTLAENLNQLVAHFKV